MREILFRGKGTHGLNSGDWIYGYYVKDFWMPTSSGFGILPIDKEKGGYCEVAPETVGQHTGLTDKNGTKIFEGDILAFSDRLVYVHWHDYCGCWDCSYIKEVKGKATLCEDRSPNKWRYNAEVIGNIHDNPKLMKGGAE